MGNSLSGRDGDDSDLMSDIQVVVFSDSLQLVSGIEFDRNDEGVYVLPDFSMLSSSVLNSSDQVDLEDSSCFNSDLCSDCNVDFSNLLVVEYNHQSSVSSESECVFSVVFNGHSSVESDVVVSSSLKESFISSSEGKKLS